MFSVITVVLLLGCFGSSQSQSAPFTNGEIEIIRGYFEANIGYAGAYVGCVVASPSSDNPDYLYHWQRDAGISMHTLQYTAPNTSTFDKPFQNYVEWVLHAQSLTDPNSGQEILGEPKFNPDGSVYTGGWCRPQNDGPASRAIALTEYAFWLISQNRTDYVKSYLYNTDSTANSVDSKKRSLIEDQQSGKSEKQKKKNNDLGSCSSIADAARDDCGYNGINQDECENTNGCCWSPIDNNPNNYPWCYYPNMTIPTVMPTTPAPTTPAPTPDGGNAIPTDLNYITTVWQDTDNCDLWEEQTGAHWYTYMVQRHALIYGASLASALGDDTTAKSWNETAASMVSSIEAFDNGTFISEQTRQLDCSIIVGTLYGGMDGLYPPNNPSVLNTLSAIQDYFNGVYEINTADTNNNIPGVLIGRYASDTYDGCLSDGGTQGHAWILCSNALGDVYYRNAMILSNEKHDADRVLNSTLLKIYSKILKYNFPTYSKALLKYAQQWKQGLLTATEKMSIKDDLARYMTTTGDDQLTRVKYHIQGCNYHMSEQICETNGVEIGAFDLTWSYGTFLSAWYYRGEAVDAGASPMEREMKVDWDRINGIATDRDGGNSCGGCYNQCNETSKFV